MVLYKRISLLTEAFFCLNLDFAAFFIILYDVVTFLLVMSMHLKNCLLVFLFLFSPAVFSADSVIGIYCQQNTNGAKVYLNEVFKFDCVDFHREAFFVEEGDYVIKAISSVNLEKEKVFSTKVHAAPDRPHRVKVTLPAATLTAYGVEMKARRDQETAKRLALEKERKLQAAVKSDIDKAEKGDLKAIQSLINRYRDGNGVAQDPQKERFWTDQYQALKTEKARQEKIASLQQQLDDNPYFFFLVTFPEVLGRANSSESSMLITSSPALTLMDIVSSPSIYSTRRGIQSKIDEVEAHAVRWAKPESMVAKASQ